MPQQTVQIICKKKGLKNLVKKIIWLQAYNACSGIWKGEGRQWVQGNGKKKIKLAKLAEVLETFATWIQTKPISIPLEHPVIAKIAGKDKKINSIYIPAGTRLTRPARPFIMLWKVPETWNEIRNRIRAFILTYLDNKTIRGGKTNSKRIVDLISKQMEQVQKNRISQIQTKSNSQVTQFIKGLDFPLVHTWRLFDSIRGKTKKTAISGQAQEQKLKYLTQIDRILKDFNRK